MFGLFVMWPILGRQLNKAKKKDYNDYKDYKDDKDILFKYLSL